MKLCKDCKHYVESTNGLGMTYDKCTVYGQKLGDVVRGEPVEIIKFCVDERYGDWLQSLIWRNCGKRARFWEAK
jgi:hypothetical protein